MTCGITARRWLDLDDIGAEIAQHHATEGAGHDLGQIEHTDARQGKLGRIGAVGHFVPWFVRRAYILYDPGTARVRESPGCRPKSALGSTTAHAKAPSPASS